MRVMLQSADWSELENNCVECMFKIITDKITEYLNMLSPVKSTKIKPNHIKNDIWMTNGLLVSSNVLNKYRMKSIDLSPEHVLSQKYRKFRNVFN